MFTQGAQEYLVLWEGYPIEDATWVQECDVTQTLLL